jgi:hypothetical protein
MAMGYFQGKGLHWRTIQILDQAQSREDTRRFRVTPAPAVASSPHEGLQKPLRAAPKPKADARADAEFSAQEQTRELIPGSAGHASGSLSHEQQIAEMLELILVLSRLERGLGGFLRGLSADGIAELESGLKEAARRASEVAEGGSPKREFFARIPIELQPHARDFYKKADAMEV